jgi:hypothetical protein
MVKSPFERLFPGLTTGTWGQPKHLRSHKPRKIQTPPGREPGFETISSLLQSLKNNLVVVLASFLLFLLTVTAFFPGQMSPDSYMQLDQALTGVYTDFHAPIMSAFWRLLLHLWGNPGVLFFFNNLCYWCFWCLLSLLLFQDWKAKLAVLGLAALPPLWSQVIVLWKDTELSICLLGAYLFIYLVKSGGLKKPSLWGHFFPQGLAVVLIFFSAAVRLNSLPALIPLAWYLVAPKSGRIFSPRVALLASCVLAFSFTAVHLFNYNILRAKKYHLFQAGEAFDIIGILVRTGDNAIIPAYWNHHNPRATPEVLVANYDPENVSTIGESLIPSDLVRITLDPSQLKELHDKWVGAIRSNPGAYLRHRWAAFNGLLRIGKSQSYYPVQLARDAEIDGIKETGDRDLRVPLKYYFWYFADSFLFKGWFYLAVAGIIMILNFFIPGPWTARNTASVCAASSALLYEGGYFFYVWNADFRYLYPAVVLSFLSVVLLISDGAQKNLEKKWRRLFPFNFKRG